MIRFSTCSRLCLTYSIRDLVIYFILFASILCSIHYLLCFIIFYSTYYTLF